MSEAAREVVEKSVDDLKQLHSQLLILSTELGAAFADLDLSPDETQGQLETLIDAVEKLRHQLTDHVEEIREKEEKELHENEPEADEE